jgi:LPS-assembly lipoprotein
MKKPLARLMLLSAIFVVVQGCGFHLQGRADYSPDLSTLYLQVPDNATPLAKALRKSLSVAHVSLVEDPEAASAILDIVSDDTGRSVESVTPQNRPREYRVYYRTSYRVLAGGKVVLDNQRVARSRIYTYDETQVLAKAHEEDILRNALAREIAGVITRRLANIEVPTT